MALRQRRLVSSLARPRARRRHRKGLPPMSAQATADSAPFRQTIARVEHALASDSRVASVRAPQPGTSISSDGHTAVVMAGAKGDPTAMVAAADKLKSNLHAAAVGGVNVSVTG